MSMRNNNFKLARFSLPVSILLFLSACASCKDLTPSIPSTDSVAKEEVSALEKSIDDAFDGYITNIISRKTILRNELSDSSIRASIDSLVSVLSKPDGEDTLFLNCTVGFPDIESNRSYFQYLIWNKRGEGFEVIKDEFQTTKNIRYFKQNMKSPSNPKEIKMIEDWNITEIRIAESSHKNRHYSALPIYSIAIRLLTSHHNIKNIESIVYEYSDFEWDFKDVLIFD